MSELALSVQRDLRRLGFRTSPAGEDFQVYTELFVNDVYRIERIKTHLLREPVPDATVIVDLGANKNWFLHLLQEKVGLDQAVENACYFRIEPQPLQVTYPVGGTVKIYHINRAIVPDAEEDRLFLPIAYDADFSAMAGTPSFSDERNGSELPGLVVNERYGEYLATVMNNVAVMLSQINVETISVRSLLDRITGELARLKVARPRMLIKIDCEYQELTIASDVLSYVSRNDAWKDFLLVAETASGGTFDASHRTSFAVEEYTGKTGLPDQWFFKVPYMLVQPK